MADRVFNFGAPDAERARKEEKPAVICTYETFISETCEADPEHPLLILRDPEKELKHHQKGRFLNPLRRTGFEYSREKSVMQTDIVKIDRRFVRLLNWLGGYRITVPLSGKQTEEGTSVYFHNVRLHHALFP
ncbi:MAG: hypothetical protein BZ136_09685 [Methanosphaera sp. rholeuAM74]|nr:MAG: hypothetical protein BZ136_09685 [Methanosphaera sp. rholeuAM74]